MGLYLEHTAVVLSSFFTDRPEAFFLLCHKNDEDHFDDEYNHRGEERHVERFEELGKFLLADGVSYILKHAKFDESERHKADESKDCELREKGRDL